MKTAALLLLLFSLAACSADTSQSVHPPPRDAVPSPSAELAPQDRDFIESAAQGGNAEIAIGTLARLDGRTSDPAIAAYGTMMVTDHSAANKRLAAIAAAKHIVLPQSLGAHQASFDRIQDKRFETFDQEFARIMVNDHQQAILLFRSEAAGGADPDLRAFAAESLPTLEAHLAQAMALAASVQGNIPDASQAPADDDLTKEKDPRPEPAVSDVK